MAVRQATRACAAGNPLGEWYADLEFWHRKPLALQANAATRDRSLHQRRLEVWTTLEADGGGLFDVALYAWRLGLFRHPSLQSSAYRRDDWHVPLDLLRQRLMHPAPQAPARP